MKKVLLIVLLAGLGLATADVSARYYRGGNCGDRCASRCERTCCPRYKVIHHDEAPCEAPCCTYWVKMTKPAICHKYSYCKWECPSDCAVDGNFDSSNLVSGSEVEAAFE